MCSDISRALWLCRVIRLLRLQDTKMDCAIQICLSYFALLVKCWFLCWIKSFFIISYQILKSLILLIWKTKHTRSLAHIPIILTYSYYLKSLLIYCIRLSIFHRVYEMVALFKKITAISQRERLRQQNDIQFIRCGELIRYVSTCVDRESDCCSLAQNHQYYIIWPVTTVDWSVL